MRYRWLIFHIELWVYPRANVFCDDFVNFEKCVMILFIFWGFRKKHDDIWSKISLIPLIPILMILGIFFYTRNSRIWFCKNNRVQRSIPVLISYCWLYPDDIHDIPILLVTFSNFSHWISHGQRPFSQNRHKLDTVGYVPEEISKSAIEIIIHLGTKLDTSISFKLHTKNWQQNRCFFPCL